MAATLGEGDLRLTGPGGYNQAVRLLQIIPGTENRRISASYTVPAPAGAWGNANQGDYTLRLEADQVRDLAGTSFPAGTIAAPQLLCREPFAIDVRQLAAAGQADVTCTAPDIGAVDHLFDQDLTTLYRTSGTNPATVRVSFGEPQTFRGFRFYGAGSDTPPAYQLEIETADTVADLEARVGSYRQLFAAAPASNRQVCLLSLPQPVTAKMVRLAATQLHGDGVLHLYDWTLLGMIPTMAATPSLYSRTMCSMPLETPPPAVRNSAHSL